MKVARLIRDKTQRCAIKSLSRIECKLEVLQNELSILRKLDHPCLLRLNEIYRDDQNFYFVTELARGGELFSLVQNKGALPE